VSRKITIEILKEYAKSHDGYCLSEEYINPKISIKWKCSNGHIWEAPWKGMYDGRWCWQCHIESLRLGIEIAKQIATERGGKCLSEKYDNWHTKLEWQCDKGHRWSACLDNIKNQLQWCPECALDKTRLSIEDCRKAASKFGGKCLSTEYKNAKSIIELECKNGHRWKTVASIILHQNKWCPRCRDKSQNVLAENIKKLYTGFSIEQKYRGFVWLNTDDGGRQEIDIFIFGLKIAIEYDGQGHFYPVNFGGCGAKTAEKIFEKTKKLDDIKDDKISQHNDDIKYFIRFSYLDDIYDIGAIRQKLIDNNIPIGDENV